MRVVVVGSGGREHSIIWKLNQDKNVRKIFCIGENYAISKVCETIKPTSEDINHLVEQIICLNPDLDLSDIVDKDPIILVFNL